MVSQTFDCLCFRIHYNPVLERWVFQDLLGRYLMELPECGWMQSYFGRLDKMKEYIISMPKATVKEFKESGK